jgi:hypothetical protein
MRKLVFAGCAGLAMLAAPASAQNNSLAGTWSFQSQSYGNEEFGVIMSGAAVIERPSRGRYSIRMLVHEQIVERETGRSRLLTARQNCTGTQDGEQFSITCQMAEPLEGYQPDNFVLQRGENADQLVGALSSAATTTVTFDRMR